jgi:hypothetical protein
MSSLDVSVSFSTSLRANGSRERAPDDRLREAIQGFKKDWIASSFALRASADAVVASLLAMTGIEYRFVTIPF